MTRRNAPAVVVVAALPLLEFAVACSDPVREESSFRAWFDDLRARTDRGDESWEAVQAGSLRALPFVRISLQRSQIYYFDELEIVFEGGERATRSGGMTDWPASTDAPLTAQVPFHEIARLCWLIEALYLPRESTS
jgi:hypothetical protein